MEVTMGSAWEAAFHIVPVAEAFLMGGCFSFLARPFLPYKKPRRKTPVFPNPHSEPEAAACGNCPERRKDVFCAGAVYAVVMLLLYYVPLSLDIFVAYCIGVAAAFFVLCFMDRRNYEQKVFLAVTFFALRWFSSALAEILYDKLYAFASRTDYMVRHPELSLALYIGVCLFYLVMELLFTLFGIWCILKAYAYKYAKMAKSELFMLVVPSAAGVVGYAMMRYYRIFYIMESGQTSDVYDILAFLYYAVNIVGIVVVIVLYQSIKAKQEERLQKELLTAQLGSIRQHTAQVERLYQNIRSIKHDMANHILILESLYAANQAEEAEAYSANLKTALAEATGEIRSGNPVTDVILQEFKNKAEKQDIRFEAEFYFPESSAVDVFDISVILNNALQNAVEHTGESKEPYIFVRSYRRNNAYMIEIRNSFAGKLYFDEESGLPVTEKIEQDDYGQAHGYGLSNIRKVARKYSGDIDIMAQEGEFRLTVLMMLESGTTLLEF